MQVDYAGNSHRSKEEAKINRAKDIKPVATAIKAKPKNEMTSMIFEEDIHNVNSYIVKQVLIPNVKRIFLTMVNEGLSMLLGESRMVSDRDRFGSRSGNIISYNKYYDSDRSMSAPKRMGYKITDMIFTSKQEAEDIIDALDDMLDDYEIVTVGDLYALANLTPDNTDYKYGWTSVRGFEIIRNREDWILRMPKAKPID